MQSNKMTPNEAKRIGLKKTLKFLIIVWLVWELVWLVKETSGDFANGILFYIDNHLHYQILVTYLGIGITFLLLGRGAGYDILIAGRKKFATAFKYIILSLLVIWSIIFILTRVDNVNWNWDTYSQILVLDTVLACPIIVIWVFTIYTISRFRFNQ
jgi:hypothetical protein